MNIKRLQQSLELMRLNMLRNNIKESLKEKENISKEISDLNSYNNLLDNFIIDRKDDQ